MAKATAPGSVVPAFLRVPPRIFLVQFQSGFAVGQHVAYEVTPLLQGFADVLNQVPAQGYAKREVGQAQRIFGKTFAPFGLTAGKNFMECDLIYTPHGLLFSGARNVDGRGFDSEQNRPTNLQIPLARK